MPALANTAPGSPADTEPTRRVEIEIDALWRLTEQLAHCASRPVAGLELITQTAGELTHADAAAIVLHPGSELVLASRWGAVGMPLGYKSADVDRALDASWPATMSLAIRRGTRDVGCLWIGRAARAFSADEERLLRTLAAVTSLALPTLTEPSHTGASAGGAGSAHPATMPTPRVATHERGRLLPEAMRLSVFPPALNQLLKAIDHGEDVDAIAAIVHTDPILPALVLRASNCAATGRARPAENVRAAIVFLGLRRVRTLALAKFTQSLVSGPGPIDALLWEQAIGTSIRTRQVAVALDPRADEDVAMLAGLLHPIGAIALAAAHPERYERTLRKSIVENRPLDDVERAAFGIDGTTLSRQLLHAWHLGAALASSLREDTAGAKRAAIAWATHVSLAANPIWQRFVTESGATVAWVETRIAEAEQALGLDPARAAAITTASVAAVETTRRLLVPSR